MLFAFTITACSAQDVGAGFLYRLNMVGDVWLERPTGNYNRYQFLIVAKHVNYPKKRSLLRFEDIPSACTNVNYAKMYIYYSYSQCSAEFQC